MIVLLTSSGSGAGQSHAGSGRAQRKLRTPLSGHYLNFTFSACEGGGGRVGKLAARREIAVAIIGCLDIWCVYLVSVTMQKALV